MNNIRWSSLQATTSFGNSNFCGGDTIYSGSATACQDVDEFVLNPTVGTFASLQEPPSLAALMNQGAVACSFVVA